MIPKVIHYCWFGGKPLPSLALKCINSWKKYLPDYEIKEWNENNFDVNMIPYISEAYQAKKYAFVSDFARFWILYNYGGLYFDTDVEVIKPLNDIIDKGPFMGCETEAMECRITVAPGLGLGVYPMHELYKEILDYYACLRFVNEDGSHNLKTVVSYTTEILYRHGLENIDKIQDCSGIWIYPKEYFCPKDYSTKTLTITNNTRAIHHYDGSWIPKSRRIKGKIIKFIGPALLSIILKMKEKFRKNNILNKQ